MNYKELLQAYNKLKAENTSLKKDNETLRNQLAKYTISSDYKNTDTNDLSAKVNNNSSAKEKISLFMSLFKGREDVYAKRWYSQTTKKSGYQPVCKNEWQHGVCDKKKYRCAVCPNRKFSSITSEIIEDHLKGEDKYGKDVVGIYPLLIDETCYLLVVDFDEEDWEKDISVFREIVNQQDIPIYIERSRSGNGAHAWIFFEKPIAANIARKLGTSLLTFVMNFRHEISFKSYDRLFPSQDIMPKGGFGNLVALPLQGLARKNNNSVFIDEKFYPYKDQWAYLSNIKKISANKVQEKINNLNIGYDLGILVKDEENKEPWGKSTKEKNITKSDFQAEVNIYKANMLYIEKKGISQKALNRFKRLGAFKNPEYYKAQAMRLPTYNKPRVISTIEETDKYLGIPRGCEDNIKEILDDIKVSYSIEDKTNHGKKIKVTFNGVLTTEQKPAMTALAKHDLGALSATTAFGKTVIGASLIAKKKVNTLVIVHTQSLLLQWQKSLLQFLDINEPEPKSLSKKGRKKAYSPVGLLGAGKNTLTNIVDVAIMQSLTSEQEVKELVKNYGLVIIDECHHVPAFSFERILKNITAKYVYGLTATPTRQDGHHSIIFMQCGPIRYKVDAKKQASKRPFDHFIIPKFTTFKKPVYQDEKNWNIAQIYNVIAKNELRNQQIIKDILNSVEKGKTPLVLTERTEHVKNLSEILRLKCKNVIKLIGSASQKEKREIMQKLEAVPNDEELVIVATGKYVGEGFDYPRLDTLFLAMPIAWKGKIHQKFAFIDQNIIWYGSINLLSFGNTEESIMRLESYEIASELMDVLTEK